MPYYGDWFLADKIVFLIDNNFDKDNQTSLISIHSDSLCYYFRKLLIMQSNK